MVQLKVRVAMPVVAILALTALAAFASPAVAQPGGQPEDFDMAGVQVWNCDYWQTVQIGDFYGPNFKLKELKPIQIVGVPNGTFSGWVVLTSSNGPMRGLKATISDLAPADGAAAKKIPASQVRVRYSERATPDKSWAPPYRFDGLLDQPPDELPTLDPKQWRDLKTPNTEPVAMQPVWVTVNVPKDAAPGDYEGKLSFEVENPALKPLEAAVKLKVYDWHLADPHDFLVQNLGWLVPEREAEYYKLEPWSDKHLAMLGKTLAMMMQIGSRQVQVNLVTHYPSIENSETMVTWVRQKDGSFTYDFTIFDKYMDVVAKAIGKPFPVRLNMWTVVRDKHVPPLPRVKVRDGETGKVEELDQPAEGSPQAFEFWKPVLNQIRARMDKRGWSDVTAPNWIQYCGGPTPEVVSMMKRIWPDGKWCDIDHGRREGFAGQEKGDWTAILTQSTVWNEGTLDAYAQWKAGPYPRQYRGKFNNPMQAFCGHARGRHREWSPLFVPRTIVEELLMRGDQGLDPVGGDMWPIKDAAGRYPIPDWAEFALGPGNAVKAYLAPGPDGPIATERFEAFREDVQICEAIIFVEKALEAGKISGELADKVNKVLDDRAKSYLAAYKNVKPTENPSLNAKAIAVGAQQRDSDLFAVAAEVAKAAGTHRSADLSGPRPTSKPEK